MKRCIVFGISPHEKAYIIVFEIHPHDGHPQKELYIYIKLFSTLFGSQTFYIIREVIHRGLTL